MLAASIGQFWPLSDIGSGRRSSDVVAALDAYESQQFWAEAEAAAAAETPEQRARRKRFEADVDGWMDSLR